MADKVTRALATDKRVTEIDKRMDSVHLDVSRYTPRNAQRSPTARYAAELKRSTEKKRSPKARSGGR